MNLKISHLLVVVVASQGAVIGCKGKDDSKGGKHGRNSKVTTLTRNALNSINMSQSFEANTPRSFRGSTGFRMASAEDECNADNGNQLATERCNVEAGGNISGTGRDEAKFQACISVSDINCRFFQPSPTNIKDILTSFDVRLNGTIEAYSQMYTPCFDSSRTAAGTFEIGVEGGSKAIPFGPFALLDLPVKSTFKNGWIFDSGLSLSLSCLSASSDGKGKYAYGYKNGLWSLFQQETIGGIFGTSDSKDNVDLWYALGDSNRDADEQAQEDAAVGNATLQAGLYPMSTTIANIISRPEEGVVGISMVGAGVGPGCGSSLIMNNKSAYFKGNINNYGSCGDADYAPTGTNGSPSHSVSLDDVEYCLDVSGATPVLANISSCYASGLLVKDDDNNLVNPFTARGLKLMTANMNSTVAGVLKARAWMGSVFMRDADVNSVAPLGGVVAEKNVVVNVVGYSGKTRSMERTTAADKQATSVTAACNATSNTTATLAETFAFNFADLVADVAAKKEGSSGVPTAAILLTDFNLSLANTGDASAYVEIPVQRTRGTTYRGNVEATATLTLDGATVGTATVSIDSANTDALTTAKIPLAGLTLTETSSLAVTLGGTLTLSCDAATATSRTVAVKPGLPRLVWYGKETLQTGK
jgi:hypothetical protein